MATNEILRFAETDTGTNLLTQSEYLADSQRPIGNQPGVARSKLVNKALRQASLIAAGLAEYIADNQANNITDALTPQNIADYLQAAITGALGVTPPQFDNGTSLATTAFVQRALGSFSAIVSYSTSTTITAADAGKSILLSPGVTITLPAANSVPAGTSFHFFLSGTGSAVVQRAGGDIIAGAASSTAVSLTQGDNVSLRSNGASGWLAYEGSARLGASGAFGSSLAANGYQRLPSGLIIQWGKSGAINVGSITTVTFPITFPTVCAAFTTSNTQGSAGATSANNYANAWINSTSSASIVTNSGTTSVAWVAVGY